MAVVNIKEEREQLRQFIIKNAYFREKIILSSGKESDYYIDARRITLTSQGAYLCAQQMLHLIGDEALDAIGGPTLGADPLIGAIGVLRLQQNKPINSFIIRKAAKAHGKGQQVEGPPLKKGSRVILVDDVATTGKAFLESIDVLSQMDVKVLKAICVVDRCEGAKEALLLRDCPLVAIFQASEIHHAS